MEREERIDVEKGVRRPYGRGERKEAKERGEIWVLRVGEREEAMKREGTMKREGETEG